MHIVKKYGNRRLYDTELSRYITHEELTQTIRDGEDVRVVDAKTGEDLTQPTLTQIIIESRGGGALLPLPVLHQLIRLQDDALAEFMGRYVAGALELYLQAKKAAAPLMPFNPFSAFNPFSQGFGGWGGPQAQPPAPPPPAAESEVEALRRELGEIKKSLQKRRKS